MTNNPFDNLVNKLLDAMPQGASDLRQDAKNNLRATLEAGLQKLNLVSRTEFEAQRAVLENTRQQLVLLETKIAELEKLLSGK